MDPIALAKAIHRLRNSDSPSEVILPCAREPLPNQPSGVLLLKPSSGEIPLDTINEILNRLTSGHGYLIRAVVWWSGKDVQEAGLMSLHYPGFHRVAHGGWAALSDAARARITECYTNDGPGSFQAVYGAPFVRERVRTPYDLMKEGVLPEQSNRLWELDRSGEPLAVRRLHRLDEDSLCVALELPLAINPVVLLNGFYAKLEKDFEAKGCIAIWIQQGAGSTTSWEALRTDYAGKTNPFQAAPNTIRGDAARGLLKVETVSILANVIHLSATEAEGEREVRQVWWHQDRLAALKKDSRPPLREAQALRAG